MNTLLSNGSVKVSKVITREALCNLLLNIVTPFAFWVSFRSVTTVQMNQYLDFWLTDANGKRKKNPNPTLNPYYGGVTCVAWRKDILLNFSYESAVNGRLEKENKESDFDAKNNWFQHVGDSKILVENKKDTTKKYMAYQYVLNHVDGQEEKKSRSEFEYYFNGEKIEKSIIEPYMKPVSNYDNQGLENPLLFQVVAIEHIKFIALNGENYEVL